MFKGMGRSDILFTGAKAPGEAGKWGLLYPRAEARGNGLFSNTKFRKYKIQLILIRNLTSNSTQIMKALPDIEC